MSNQEPGRHHYVPEFLINNFRKNGDLFALSRVAPYPKIRKTHAKKIMFEWNSNTLTSFADPANNDVENKLGKFDTIAALTIGGLVANGRASRPLNISDTDHDTLARTLLTLFARSPAVRKKMADVDYAKTIIDSSLQKYMQMGGVLNQFQKQAFSDKNYIAVLAQNAAISGTLNDWPLSFAALMSKQIVIARPEKSSKSFILGDNPLHREHGNNGEKLDHPNAQWWLAIAHDTLMGFVGRTSSVSIIRLDDDKMRSINRIFWQQSSVAVSSSAELLKSLANDR